VNADLIVAILSESGDPEYNAHADFLERVSNNYFQLSDELKQSQGKGRLSWPKIPAALLKRIWLDYGRSGVVRNEKGLEKVADIMLGNIARLQATTEMMGHTPIDARKELEDNYEITFTDQEWDDWMTDYFTDESGQWTLSDYGLPKLVALYGKIFNAATAEEKLQVIDRALNIIHQRSDLAGLFVEGGSKTLMEIFNQGGYTSESEEDDDLVKDVAGPTDAEDSAAIAAVLPDVVRRKEAYLNKKCVRTSKHTNPQGETFVFGQFGVRNSTIATLLYFDPEKGWVPVDIRDTFAESEDDDVKDVYGGEPVYLPLGTVSRGTMVVQDIVPRCLFVLRTVDTEAAELLEERWRETPEEEEQEFCFETLWNVMQKHCAPYTYFGPHRGNTSDYGVWVDVDEIDSDVESGDLSATKEPQPVTGATPYTVVVDAAGTYHRLVSGTTGTTIWIDE
jgi:hypothetical protein